MRCLNIIGCGSLGQSLARLWRDNEVFQIGHILNRSIESAQSAVDYIGDGTAAERIEEIIPSDSYLIATADSQIQASAEALAASRKVDSNTLVFHCSGVLSSDLLSSLREQGASVASAHPLRSFARPILSKEEFSGTYCAIEGDDKARVVLSKAFEAIGASIIAIDAKDKALYHAAGAIVCNYLTTLMELGLQTYEESGIERDLALKMIEPFVRGTLDNFFAVGPVKGLSGPIARGDCETIESHLRALEDWSQAKADLYRLMGQITLELSRKQGTASEEAFQGLEALLKGSKRTSH